MNFTACQCLHENYSVCLNKDHVKSRKLVTFSNDTSLADSIEAVENEMYNSMYDLICKETVIAVRPNVDNLSRLFSVSC